MSRSAGGLGLGRRLRAKLRGEVRVWGLTAPARIGWDGGVQIECAPADRELVRGFACAALAMPALDLQRRLWSGRLAELVGERAVSPEVSAPDLDVFVRLLGLREDAERAFKAMPRKVELEAFARGVNAWIDAGRWQKDPAWAELRSRPRLWGPADSLLLATAPARVDGGHLVVPSEPGWPDAWTARLSQLWAALHGELRAPGGPGGALPGARLDPVGWPEGLEVGSTGGAMQVVPVQVHEGGDNQRYAHGDGFRRLRVRRHDVPVRGGSPRRPWVRRAGAGPLISDLLAGADGPVPPAGPAFALGWSGGSPGPTPEPRDPLPDGHPWRLPAAAPPRRARLVPMDGGA